MSCLTTRRESTRNRDNDDLLALPFLRSVVLLWHTHSRWLRIIDWSPSERSKSVSVNFLLIRANGCSLELDIVWELVADFDHFVDVHGLSKEAKEYQRPAYKDLRPVHAVEQISRLYQWVAPQVITRLGKSFDAPPSKVTPHLTRPGMVAAAAAENLSFSLFNSHFISRALILPIWH